MLQKREVNVRAAVVKVRLSAPEHCSATSNFARVVLCHVYVCRGELRSSVREGERSKCANTLKYTTDNE